MIGEELSAALSAAHQELGVTHVRAHGIFCDDVAVYREEDGDPVHDFSGVDRVYDHIRSLGLYPVVEISYMPHDLASDPTKTVFEYAAIISPPKDWERWYDLVRAFTAHLLERYGDEVVEQWSFEVWNEANLEVFWSGTPEEYLKLYDVTAAAVRRRRLPAGRRRTRRPPPPAGSRSCSRTPTARRRRSTSSPRTPTARRRSTSGRCWSATGGQVRRSGGPSGA